MLRRAAAHTELHAHMHRLQAPADSSTRPGNTMTDASTMTGSSVLMRPIKPATAKHAPYSQKLALQDSYWHQMLHKGRSKHLLCLRKAVVSDRLVPLPPAQAALDDIRVQLRCGHGAILQHRCSSSSTPCLSKCHRVHTRSLLSGVVHVNSGRLAQQAQTKHQVTKHVLQAWHDTGTQPAGIVSLQAARDGDHHHRLPAA